MYEYFNVISLQFIDKPSIANISKTFLIDFFTTYEHVLRLRESFYIILVPFYGECKYLGVLAVIIEVCVLMTL